MEPAGHVRQSFSTLLLGVGFATFVGLVEPRLACSQPEQVKARHVVASKVVASDVMERGRLIASGGGPGGPSAACFTCHGVDGAGQRQSGFPRLAGLAAPYLAKQLDDYASGARMNDIMAPIARQLGVDDRKAAALYYSRLSGRSTTVSTAEGSDPALIQAGAVLYARGAAARSLQACLNCHGPHARGLAPAYPALAGQPPTYIEAQLRSWRSGHRSNSIGSVMENISRRMTDRDIEAVAEYLAALDPAKD